MIPGDVEPIGHISPLPRIELHSRQQPYDGPALPVEAMSISEKQRIWAAVVATAESTNIVESES
jgi:hypothetical protein